MEQTPMAMPKEMKDMAANIAKTQGLSFAAYVQLAISERMKKDMKK